MTINKKIMTILLSVMAIGVVTTTYATTSFIGEDCSIYEQNRMNGKACNDIQQLFDSIEITNIIASQISERVDDHRTHLMDNDVLIEQNTNTLAQNSERLDEHRTHLMDNDVLIEQITHSASQHDQSISELQDRLVDVETLGFYTIDDTGNIATPGLTSSITVNCNAGDQATGGGFQIVTGNRENIQLTRSEPVNNNSWIIEAYHSGDSGQIAIKAFVICAELP